MILFASYEGGSGCLKKMSGVGSELDVQVAMGKHPWMENQHRGPCSQGKKTELGVGGGNREGQVNPLRMPNQHFLALVGSGRWSC